MKREETRKIGKKEAEEKKEEEKREKDRREIRSSWEIK